MKFEDIRKGDRIRVTWQAGDLAYSMEGVADTERAGYWTTREGKYLVSKEDTCAFELVNRPSPQEPEGLGKIIRYGEDTYVSVRAVPGTLRWCMTPRGGRESGLFYCWSDFEPERIEIL